MNFTGFINVCKRLGIRISFSLNSYQTEYHKNDESGNPRGGGGYSGIFLSGMCEWGEIVRPKKSHSGQTLVQKKSNGPERNPKKVQLKN